MSVSQTPGQSLDALIVAKHRLRAVHLVLGLVGSFSVWTESSVPHFSALSRGAGWVMIVLSVLGWAPYLISWFYSRTMLDRNSRAVAIFSFGALLITIIGAAFYQNVFSFSEGLSPIVVSFGVMLSLLGTAKLCSLLWHPPRDEV
jgi:uncharacterized membrane protein